MKKFLPILVSILYYLQPLPSQANSIGMQTSETTEKAVVDFSNSFNYTDIDYDGTNSEAGHRIVLQEIKDTFTKSAEAAMLNGYQIRIRVTDVDLAGAFEPGGMPDEPRIGTGIFPSKIDFDFEIINPQGSVVADGSESLKGRRYFGERPGLLDDDYGIIPDITDLILEWFKSYRWPDEIMSS